MTYPHSAQRAETRSRPPRSRLAELPSLRHWLATAVVLSALMLACGLIVRTTAVTQLELPVDQSFSAHHVRWMTSVSLAIEQVFGPKGAIVIVLLVMAFLWFVRRARVDALAVGSVTGFGWVFSLLFKYTVDRPRPDQHLLLDPLSPGMDPESFPSGHVCFAISLTIALYFLLRHRRWGVWVLAVGMAGTFFVAVSRVYIGEHYPTDVIASIPVSLAGIILWCGLWNRFSPPVLERLPFIARLEGH
ncbi:phosphatase PAP2 family protein [Sinomonas atrocyanea]